MALIDPGLAYWLIGILGITNLIGMVLVLLSCRCLLARWTGWGTSKAYMAFYRHHCKYWWFFMASVFFHTMLAMGLL